MDFSLGLSSEEFREEINTIMTNSTPPYITEATSNIIIGFNCYDPSQDRFVTTSITIDFSIAGMLVPYPIKIISYSLDLQKQTSPLCIVIDGFQAFFCFCYFVRAFFLKGKCHHTCFRLKNKYMGSGDNSEDKNGMNNEDGEEKKEAKKEEEEQEEEIDGYSPTCSIITDLMVIMAFILKFRYSQMTNYHDIDGILNENYMGVVGEQYIELTHFADYYLEQYQMYTLIIIFNIYNLVGALRIFRLVHWIMLIIERTFEVVTLFMMLLLPCQLGFSFLSYVFVGPYVKKYDSLIGGFKQQIITMMGQQDSMALMRANYNFTVIWTMSFIIFFAYFFVTSSIVAFEDGFDETVKEKGYPNDF